MKAVRCIVGTLLLSLVGIANAQGFRIDHWGEPKAVLVNPVTDVSSCVAKGSWYFTFPHPGERFAKEGLAILMPISIK